MRFLSKFKELFFLFGSLLSIISVNACRHVDEVYDNVDVHISFSQDSIRFDTVFTNFSTITQSFKVFNLGKKTIEFNNIQMEKGYFSRFRLNVNGDTNINIRNIVLRPKDSLFVFITARINTLDQNNPVEITDRIIFQAGKSTRYVAVSAWGQDAYYHKSLFFHRFTQPNKDNPSQIDTISMPYFFWDNSQPFKTDKPHIIYGFLTVKSNETLEIPEGARLFFAPASGIWVQERGEIRIQGRLGNPVLLTGIRQDASYREMAGQWDRIWIDCNSEGNKIDYAWIKNANTGIWLDSCPNGNMQLEISNTLIGNMTYAGIYAHQGKISGYNNVVYNCAESALYFEKGGNFDFTHCTFTNYWNASFALKHSLYINDYGQNDVVYPLEKANFTNCIFWGNTSSQIILDIKDKGKPSYYFDHCLLKTSLETNERFNNCKINADPVFTDPLNGKFQIDTICSPAVRNGNPNVITGPLSIDILGNTRQIPSTLGAYEFIPPTSD